MANDLQEIDQRTDRHTLLVGTQEDGEPVLLNARRTNVLIAGPSSGGKSSLAMSLLEQLTAQVYQFCLFDPEGDYEEFQGAITLGNPQKEPAVSEITQLLEKPEQSAILNLLGSPFEERPTLFRNLLPTLQDLQVRFGHPHWLIVDEAHHLAPPEWEASPLEKVRGLFNLLLITTHPDHVSKHVLGLVDVVIVVGTDAGPTLSAFSKAVGLEPPEMAFSIIEPGEICVWYRHSGRSPLRVRPKPSKEEHQRHRRKYAEGSLGEDVSFYFRGPEDKLRLRAQNLIMFSQLAQGVDDETWLFHLRQGDYSRWFREVIKDDDLAREAESIEKDVQLTPRESRAKIQSAIEQRYTLPL